MKSMTMSEVGEELGRIASALEIIAKQGKPVDERTIVMSVKNWYIQQLDYILDNNSNEFALRREMRRFICKEKDSLEQ